VLLKAHFPHVKQDLRLDARRVLCCVVCVFGFWHGVKPEARAVGLDSYRRSLMRDKAQTQKRSVESRAAPSFSPLLHRDLFLLTLVSYCAKLPTNTGIISCLHLRQTQGRAVEKGGGQRGTAQTPACGREALTFSVPQHQLACCPLCF